MDLVSLLLRTLQVIEQIPLIVIKSASPRNSTIDHCGSRYHVLLHSGVSLNPVIARLLIFSSSAFATCISIYKRANLISDCTYVIVLDRVLEESHTIDGRTVEVKRAIPRDKTAFGPRLVLQMINIRDDNMGNVKKCTNWCCFCGISSTMTPVFISNVLYDIAS